MLELQSYEDFVRSYQNMVFSTAYRLLANHAEAQDISQQVFLKAYERYSEIGGSPRVGGWLKTVTRNLCLNHLTRYRKRWRFFSDFKRDGEEDRESFEDRVSDNSIDIGVAQNTRDQREILEQALESLPEGQRVAIALFHFDDMPYQEIADTLNVSLSKVKTDIMRGRQALRRKLESNREELGV